MLKYVSLVIIGALICAYAYAVTANKTAPEAGEQPLAPVNAIAVATFAGGCFWCMEPPFEGLPGIRSVISGYTGGLEVNPRYEEVARGRTGHTESVQIDFNPEIIGFDELLEIFWRSFDPTDPGGQFADRGTQYRPGVFFHSEEQRLAVVRSKAALEASGRFDRPIAIEITAFMTFYRAEEYHQDYYKKNPVHYNAYAIGSGRKGFLKKVWADDHYEPKALRETQKSTGG